MLDCWRPYKNNHSRAQAIRAVAVRSAPMEASRMQAQQALVGFSARTCSSKGPADKAFCSALRLRSAGLSIHRPQWSACTGPKAKSVTDL